MYGQVTARRLHDDQHPRGGQAEGRVASQGGARRDVAHAVRFLAVRIVRLVEGVMDLLPDAFRADKRPPPEEPTRSLGLIAPHVEARRAAERNNFAPADEADPVGVDPATIIELSPFDALYYACPSCNRQRTHRCVTSGDGWVTTARFTTPHAPRRRLALIAFGAHHMANPVQQPTFRYMHRDR